MFIIIVLIVWYTIQVYEKKEQYSLMRVHVVHKTSHQEILQILIIVAQRNWQKNVFVKDTFKRKLYYLLSHFFPACESGFVSIWEIPDGGLAENITSPVVVLKGQSKSLTSAIYCIIAFCSVSSSADNNLQVLLNSSGQMKAESNKNIIIVLLFIPNSSQCKKKLNMPTLTNVKFPSSLTCSLPNSG